MNTGQAHAYLSAQAEKIGAALRYMQPGEKMLFQIPASRPVLETIAGALGWRWPNFRATVRPDGIQMEYLGR